MLASRNILKPADGQPVVTPRQDMVLGCYYLTLDSKHKDLKPRLFGDYGEVQSAFDLGVVGMHDPVKFPHDGKIIDTTVGRVMFNAVLPEDLRFVNKNLRRDAIRDIVIAVFEKHGNDVTADVVDKIKRIGFAAATHAGVSISIDDVTVPAIKATAIAATEKKVGEIDRQFSRGLITEEERYGQTVDLWTATTETVVSAMMDSLDKRGSVYMMATSGARGNPRQMGQIGGMRGLIADPQGRIIDLPIRSNFREGLSVLEYFISTHGGRKGLADTAIRTADSGYLTRRLVDVAQDVIVRLEDCGDEDGIFVNAEEVGMIEPFPDRLFGRVAAMDVDDPKTKQRIVSSGEDINRETAKLIAGAGVKRMRIRSPLSCHAKYGICRACYGRSMATGKLVESGEAVGIIAAQSIGEPGTQLTMRTFHTGGVAGEDITMGLPRVEEIFEARVPKGLAVIAEIDGIAEIVRDPDGSRKIVVRNMQEYTVPISIPGGYVLNVEDGAKVTAGEALAKPERRTKGKIDMPSPVSGTVHVQGGGQITIAMQEVEERIYEVAHQARLRIDNGKQVAAGDFLTEGSANPQDILRISGREAVHRYMVAEVQKVYRSQGVTINDKHIEIIVRQMLRGAVRPLRVRGHQRPHDRGGWRAGNGTDGAPRRDEGVAVDVVLPRGRVVPGDHPRPHRGRDDGSEGPAARPQGERHHRQAHPGGHWAPVPPRHARLDAEAEGPRRPVRYRRRGGAPGPSAGRGAQPRGPRRRRGGRGWRHGHPRPRRTRGRDQGRDSDRRVGPVIRQVSTEGRPDGRPSFYVASGSGC